MTWYAVALGAGALCGCAALVDFPDRTGETSAEDGSTSDATAVKDALEEPVPETSELSDASDAGRPSFDAGPTFCQMHDGAAFCDDFESSPLDASWDQHPDTLKGSISIVPDPADASNHVLQLGVAADSPGYVNSSTVNGLYVSRGEDASTGAVYFQFDVAVENPTTDAGQEVMEIFQLYGQYLRMRVIGHSVDFTQYFYDAGQELTTSPWDANVIHTVSVSLASSLTTLSIDGTPVVGIVPVYPFDPDKELFLRLGNTALADDAGAQQVRYDNVLFASP